MDGLITFDSHLNNQVNKMNNKQLKTDVDDDVTWSVNDQQDQGQRELSVSWTFTREGWPTVTVAS